MFNEKAERIRRSSFVKKLFGSSHGFTIRLGQSNTVTVERTGADEESTDALILTLRFFLTSRDGISLDQMKTLYDGFLTDKDEREMVEKAFTEHYQAQNEPLHIIFNGKPLTRWIILETVLYGDRAHANDDKRPIYDQWREVNGFDVIVDHQFEDAVAEVVFFVLELQRFNEQILQRIA